MFLSAIDREFAEAYIAARSDEEANHVWFKYLSKNKAKKKLSSFLDEDEEGIKESFMEWDKMAETRKWQATISISASGPEHDPIFNDAGRKFTPRAVSDLKYTTADSDYLAEHFKKQDSDSCEFETHFRLVNPTIEQLKSTIKNVDKWFCKYRNKPDWDGGGIVLIYAGHGDEAAGEMALKNDTRYSPEAFIENVLDIAKKTC